MTREQLISALRGIRGCRVISFTTETIPSMRKGGNPWYGRIVKRSYVNGLIGFNYQNSVNNALIRQGEEADFTAGPRAWGERIDGTPLVYHEGQYYLEVKVQRSTSEYFTMEGERVDECEVRPYLRAPSPSAIVLRDYAIKSLTSIQYHGETLEVTQ